MDIKGAWNLLLGEFTGAKCALLYFGEFDHKAFSSPSFMMGKGEEKNTYFYYYFFPLPLACGSFTANFSPLHVI